MLTNASRDELFAALEEVNKKYEGNITFKKIEPRGNKMQFTLTVNDSRGPGAKRNPVLDWEYTADSMIPKIVKWRRVSAACWHVHGDFFNALFEINPDAYVHSAVVGRITAREGNWIDYQVGPNLFPYYASYCCNCEEFKC